MIAFKDFADSGRLTDRYDLIDYPGYYLDKQYQYRICTAGTSFDDTGKTVMAHGGISIDEVIVPFVKIERVSNE